MANEITLCRLTAKKIGPSSGGDLTRPKIFNVAGGDIKNLRRNHGAVGSVFEQGFKPNGQSKIEVYEDPGQVRLNLNVTQGVTGGLYDDDMDLGVAGAGADLAGATLLAKYFNKVSAVTATSADGVKLPATPVAGDVLVVLNNATAGVDVFPGDATATIDDGAVSAVKTVAVGQSIHFVCQTGGASAAWQSATDEDNS